MMKKIVLFLLAVFALACGNSRAVDNCTTERAEAPAVLQYDREMFPDSNIVDDEIKLVRMLDGLSERSSNLDVQNQLRFFRETALPLILNDTTTIECRTFRPTLEAYKNIVFMSTRQPDSLKIPIKDLNIPGYDMKCEDSFNIDVLPLPKGLVAIRILFDRNSKFWRRGSGIYIIMEPTEHNDEYRISSRGGIVFA